MLLPVSGDRLQQVAVRVTAVIVAEFEGGNPWKLKDIQKDHPYPVEHDGGDACICRPAADLSASLPDHRNPLVCAACSGQQSRAFVCAGRVQRAPNTRDAGCNVMGDMESGCTRTDARLQGLQRKSSSQGQG